MINEEKRGWVDRRMVIWKEGRERRRGKGRKGRREEGRKKKGREGDEKDAEE